jgi:hypothetical protein
MHHASARHQPQKAPQQPRDQLLPSAPPQAVGEPYSACNMLAALPAAAPTREAVALLHQLRLAPAHAPGAVVETQPRGVGLNDRRDQHRPKHTSAIYPNKRATTAATTPCQPILPHSLSGCCLAAEPLATWMAAPNRAPPAAQLGAHHVWQAVADAGQGLAHRRLVLGRDRQPLHLRQRQVCTEAEEHITTFYPQD